jgi:hypothetical protein
MRYIVKEPGKPPVVIEREGRPLYLAQEAGGGYVEPFFRCADFIQLCDEEGRLKDYPYHVTANGQRIHGPICIVGIVKDDSGEEDWGSLSEPLADALMEIWQTAYEAEMRKRGGRDGEGN